MHATAVVGSLAPEFDLPSTAQAGRSRLADYRGRWLAVVFYPRDFSLVCPTELTALSQRFEEFERRGCDILGISADSLDSHRRWIATPRAHGGLHGLRYPLASDIEGEVCRAYGVFLELQHVALRGLFIIDANGVLQYQVVHNLSVGRRADEVLRVLAALQTGGLCGESWSPGETTIESSPRFDVGSSVSHYRLEERIGSGSFATVFRAVDTTLERTVALKILRTDSPVDVTAALAEARVAASLSHANVCTIFGIDDSEGAPLIAMEYLVGQSLADRIAGGPLPLEAAVDIARQIAAGMDAAHQRGIVHGDLKPANVFVTEAGVVKILDFGLSRREQRGQEPDATTELFTIGSTKIAGTPSYMAPEQAVGEPPQLASDVFAWGATVYEMVTGRKAFPGENVLQTLSRIRRVDPQALADEAPAPLGALLGRAMVRDPATRSLSMREIAAELESWPANSAVG